VRQIIFPKASTVEVADVPQPKIKTDEILIRTTISSVIASEDIAVYKGKDPRTSDPSSPYYTGFPHYMCGECVGEVVAVGDSVVDLVIADRVVFLGTYAEFVSLPAHMAVRIPDNISAEEAISCVYSATSLQCVRRARPEIGDQVVILGQGVVGLMVTQWCRIAGAGEIIVTDKYPMRLEVAKTFGATHALIAGNGDIAKDTSTLTEGQGADIVIIAATVPELLDLGMSIARKKGRIVVLAFFSTPVTMRDMTRDFFLKELDMLSTMGQGPSADFTSPYCRWSWLENIKTGIQYLQAGRITTTPLLTHRLSVEEVAEAMRLLDEEPHRSLKVILKW